MDGPKKGKQQTGKPLGENNPHKGNQIDGRAKSTANEHLTVAHGSPHKQEAHVKPPNVPPQNDGTVPGIAKKPVKNVEDGHGKILDDWTEVPPAPVQFQTVQALSVSGGASTLLTWGPLTAGDELEDVLILAQTVATAATAETITFGLYASDNPINSVAQAQASNVIIPAVTIAGDGEGTSSTTNVFTFRALMPTLYRCALQGRYLAAVVTAGADNTAGYVALAVRRHLRWYFPWGAPPVTTD